VASKLSQFLAELKRRKVYRVAAVYAAVGVAISLAVPDLFGAFDLPSIAARLVILLTAVGFPIALLLAWAYEVKPEAVRLEETGAGNGSKSAPLTPPQSAGGHLPPSIAVLPFANLSAEPEQEFFCDGMAEELINNLTRVEGLRVAARTSSFLFKDSPEDVREVGRRLGVSSILEGSVRRSGDRLRVTAQLIDALDGYHLWSETYERELADVFDIQDEISRAIVDTVRPTLVGEPRLAPPNPSTQSMEAYDLYLQGRVFWHQRYQVGIQRGLECFQGAVALDPEFALPYTGIADAFVSLGLYGYVPPAVAREKAQEAVSAALALDPDLGQAYGSRGWMRFMCTWEWEAAEKDYQRSLELSPSNVDGRSWYGILCAAQGRFTEAYAQMAAAKALDPLSSYLASQEGAVAFMARDYHRAVGILEDVLQREPDYLFGVFVQEIALVGAGRYEEAVALGKRGLALSENSDFFQMLLVGALAAVDREGEAMGILDGLRGERKGRYVAAVFLARGLAALGAIEPALEFLSEAVEAKDPFLFPINQDQAWDPIREDSRFQSLAQRVGEGVVGSSHGG
jgi:serine/threonine-protein kinase